MKFTTRLSVLIVLACTAFSSASAAPVFGTSPRGAGGSFGIGLSLGDPIGFSAKYYVSTMTAIDAALGYGFGRVDGFQVHVDYVIHPHVLHSSYDFKLSWLVGIGAAIDVGDTNSHNEAFLFGFRVPVGMSAGFHRHPFDLSFQFAPGASFVEYAGFRFDIALITHYYF